MEKLEQGTLSRLVRDSQAGDPQAREQLVLSVQDYVHFYCRVMTDTPDDAMDAAQDILIAMLTGLKGLKAPEAFWGWLRQIVIRTCRKRTFRTQREQGRQRSLETLQGEPDSELTGLSGLEELVERQEIRRAVMDLVDALPPQQRMCVLLFYYEEMPVEDIAAALHVPEGTVKSRLHYARKAIQRGAEQSAHQGFPLYGLSPLPLLGAVLQQEAAAAAGSAVSAGLTQAALAAGGTAAGVTAKAVLGVVAGKKAAALAGLALTAVVAGGVLLTPAAPAVELPAPPAVWGAEPSQPAPPGVQEDQPAQPVPPPAPQTAEAPVRQEAFTQPETARPVALPAVSVDETAVEPVPSAAFVTPPPEEEAPDLPEVSEPAGHGQLPPQEEPEDGLPPDGILEFIRKLNAPPETEPEPPRFSRNPGFNLPVDVFQPNIPPVQEDPKPAEPEPAAPEPVDPEPVTPEPVVTTLAFEGDMDGKTGYGYTYSFVYAWNGVLPDGPLVYSSSNPSVVSVNEEGEFTTLAPGSAVLSAAPADDPTRRYDLVFTVENRFKWQYYLSDAVLQEGQSECYGLDAYSISNLAGYDIQIERVEWTSSNPEVVSLEELPSTEACAVYAVSLGTATVTGTVTFRVDTIEGERTMQDVCSFTVTVTGALPEEPPAEPEVLRRKELTNFGFNSGYGYQSTFAAEWGEALPEGLVYASSNEDAVRISGETGEFYTVSAGEANLTATDPSEPDNPYVLAVRVQNCFQWTYTAEPLTVQVHQSAPCSIADCVLPDNTWTVYSMWISSDTGIASPSYSTYWQYNDVTGVRPGLASITCIINFDLKTFEGYVRMRDTVRFQVEVVLDLSTPLPDGSDADETA